MTSGTVRSNCSTVDILGTPLVYIVLLHDFRNRSHTNCSTVDILGTPFDTHCKHQISLQCPVCPERECRYWFREMDCHINKIKKKKKKNHKSRFIAKYKYNDFVLS